MSATYTKLRSGEWGVRVEGAARAGQTITVRKKDGSTKTETIEKVVWTGNGVSLCAVKSNKSGGGYAPQAGKPASRRDCDDFCQGCRLCR
jgi:hypothetical protein